jgi:hypothetical protein
MTLRIWPVCLAAFAAVVVIYMGGGVAHTQTTAVLRSLPSLETIREGDRFDVAVTVERIQGLGAFQFTLTYDDDILEFVSVQEGDFLGSSGRTVNCLPPSQQATTAKFACVTLGAQPPGADGSGVLATVTLDARRQGPTPLELENVVLATIDGKAIPSSVENSVITVIPSEPPSGGSINWALWGSVGAGSVLVVVLAIGLVRSRRLRS